MPDDEYEFKLANKASDMMCTLTDIAMMFRNVAKHGIFNERQLSETDYMLFEELRKWFYETVESNDLNLDEL